MICHVLAISGCRNCQLVAFYGARIAKLKKITSKMEIKVEVNKVKY
jgi:hypothetical protein